MGTRKQERINGRNGGWEGGYAVAPRLPLEVKMFYTKLALEKVNCFISQVNLDKFLHLKDDPAQDSQTIGLYCLYYRHTEST